MLTEDGKVYPVERLKRLYLGTRNPIYAWKTYQAARRLRVPVPEEIMEYLDSVAFEVAAIASRPPAPNERPRALAKALRLNKEGPGPGSDFGEFTEQEQRRQIAIETAREIEAWGGEGKKDYAFDQVARRLDISKSTVRRIYKEYQEKWKAEAEYLIRVGLVFRRDEKVLYKGKVVSGTDDYDESEIVFDKAKSLIMGE